MAKLYYTGIMKFKEGDRVEVLRSKEEQYGSWFPAKITWLNGYTYTVRYELFHTSDGKPVVETVHEGDLRPSPPPQDRRELRWVVGGIAEVLDLCAWRVGKVMKVIKEDRIVIKLFGSIQLQEHSVSDLRVPQAWQNNQWLMIDMVTDRCFNAFLFLYSFFFPFFCLSVLLDLLHLDRDLSKSVPAAIRLSKL
ncbi:hypothetical protein BHE74_00056671 [Ensete ventricosum]|nr:hypothetical protein BHE74_00056671 [Ensete ventricosum]